MSERAPYTAEQRQLQGNPGKSGPSNTNDVIATTPLDYVPEPPDMLHGESDMSAMSVATWRAIAPMLVEARTLRESDLFSLARYCRYTAEWVQLTQDIDRFGFTVVNESKHGTATVPNPAVMARKRVDESIQALERELGLSPASRMKVQKTLMAALKDLPLAGRQATANRGGAIGFLNDDE